MLSSWRGSADLVETQLTLGLNSKSIPLEIELVDDDPVRPASASRSDDSARSDRRSKRSSRPALGAAG